MPVELHARLREVQDAVRRLAAIKLHRQLTGKRP
jgi:hypothetical protein